MAHNYLSIFNIREKYYLNGYRPIAILNRQKRPIDECWPFLARQNPPTCSEVIPNPLALGTGILCDGLRAIDIDVDDKELADYLIEYILINYGSAPVRYRNNSPRVTLLYAAAEGSPPKAFVKNRVTGHGIEILGHGNQFVSDGIHPSGATLLWINGPEITPRDELVQLNGEEITDIIDYCTDVLQVDYVSYGDHEINKPSDTTPVLQGHPGGSGKLCIADIEAALDAIPNLYKDYDFWWDIGASVYMASGGSHAGYEAWRAWSSRNSDYNEKFTKKKWNHYSTSPVRSITAGTLVWRAQQCNSTFELPSRSFTPLNIFNKRNPK